MICACVPAWAVSLCLVPVALLSAVGAALRSPSRVVTFLVLVEASGALSSVAYVLQEPFVGSLLAALAATFAALPAAARLVAFHPTIDGLAAGDDAAMGWGRSPCPALVGRAGAILFGRVIYPLLYLVGGLLVELLLYASALGAVFPAYSPWRRRGGRRQNVRAQAVEQEARAAAVSQLIAQFVFGASPLLAVQIYNSGLAGWSAAALVSATLSGAVVLSAVWLICEPHIAARFRKRLLYDNVERSNDEDEGDSTNNNDDGDGIGLAEVAIGPVTAVDSGPSVAAVAAE